MDAPPVASVLVVDDDAPLRLLCRVVLELEHFAVREAATVAEAEDALTKARPDVVLLDVHLAGEPSDTLFTRLLEDGIPVAVVTGSADIEDYRERADAVLSKPFLPNILAETARRLARVGP